MRAIAFTSDEKRDKAHRDGVATSRNVLARPWIPFLLKTKKPPRSAEAHYINPKLLQLTRGRPLELTTYLQRLALISSTLLRVGDHIF